MVDELSPNDKNLPPLEEYGIDLETLRIMYREWSEKRIPKSAIERRYLGTGRQHGKLFTRLVREYLGHDTEKQHPLKQRIVELEAEVSRLRDLLAANGIRDPKAPVDANGPNLFDFGDD